MPPQSEWEPKFCAPGRPIYINHPDNTLVETRPKNAQYYRRTIVWSTIHEYSHSYRRLGHHQWIQRKNKEIILKFIRQEFPFLCTLVNKHRKPCHNYGPFQFYGKKLDTGGTILFIRHYLLESTRSKYWPKINTNYYTCSKHIPLTLLIFKSSIPYSHGCT